MRGPNEGRRLPRGLCCGGQDHLASEVDACCRDAAAAYKDVDEVVRVSHELGIGRLVAKVAPVGVMKG